MLRRRHKNWQGIGESPDRNASATPRGEKLLPDWGFADVRFTAWLHLAVKLIPDRGFADILVTPKSPVCLQLIGKSKYM